MPALSGADISTITDGTGQPVFVVYRFFDPVTYDLRDASQVTSTGTKTGAVIVDNMTGKQQAIVVRDQSGAVIRSFNVPRQGVALTAAQLAALPPPNGPVTNISDIAGIQSSLT